MSASVHDLGGLAASTADKFRKHYGCAPQWMVAAPGRVNLIGEHTDYNDGFVLPMAIERYTVLAAAPTPVATGVKPRVLWRSETVGETAELPLDVPWAKGQPQWADYVRGVFAGFGRLGHKAAPMNVLMDSSVPLGSGLSSSAALEVATATLLEAALKQPLDPVAKALLCQKAEHEFAGVPCGIMDQFTSAMGQEGNLLLLDCRSRETQLVPMSDPDVAVMILNTQVRHELAGGEYAKRRAECESAAKALGVASLRDADPDQLDGARSRMSETVYRRARHVISEIERTTHAAMGIQVGNWITVGQLMYASHRSLRDDYEVSCKELDALVEIAQDLGPEAGVYGCRMTGGGFGGCAVALVQQAKSDILMEHFSREYLRRTELQPAIFVSRPAQGARVLEL